MTETLDNASIESNDAQEGNQTDSDHRIPLENLFSRNQPRRPGLAIHSLDERKFKKISEDDRYQKAVEANDLATIKKLSEAYS